MKFRSDAYVFRFESMMIHLASSCFGPVWIGLDTYLRLPKAAADRTASAQYKAEEMACPEAKPIPASTVQIPWFEPLLGSPIGNLVAAAEFESSDGHVTLSRAGELERKGPGFPR